MAGISDQALQFGQYNKFRYNGKEEQNKEFADGSGLNWYDYGARMQDAQLGRFFTCDRFSEKYSALSPYQYGGNNPVLNIDVNGDSVWSTSSVAKNKNGTTTTTYTTHITGKVLNADNGPTDGVAQGVNDAFNRTSTQSVDSKGNTTIINFDAKFEEATDMSQVSASDHLLVIVDDVNGKADPAMGGGEAGGLASERGKIAYIEHSNNKAWMVEGGVHEIGHNLGLDHQKLPAGNYMSYDNQKSFFTPLQTILMNNYARSGVLNQGQNSQGR